jgi:hypothetical protein
MTVKDVNNKTTFAVSESGGVKIGGSLYIGPIEDGKTVDGAIEDAEKAAK